MAAVGRKPDATRLEAPRGSTGDSHNNGRRSHSSNDPNCQEVDLGLSAGLYKTSSAPAARTPTTTATSMVPVTITIGTSLRGSNARIHVTSSAPAEVVQSIAHEHGARSFSSPVSPEARWNYSHALWNRRPRLGARRFVGRAEVS
jgi:hypothetical protein